MRTPIWVRGKTYDIDSAQAQIDAVRECFSRYLDSYIPKSSASKHGLMGPVGKILSEAKSGRSDSSYLKGYVVRVHELSQKRSPSPEGMQALEEGIDQLAKLLQDVPPTAHDLVLDRLDYGLYFARRKRFLQWLEERDRLFREWLKQKYAELPSLASAWGRKIEDWGRIRYGGSGSQTYKTAPAPQREDLEAFARHLKELGRQPVAEIEEEIEE